MRTKMLFMAIMVILCLTACSKDETGVYDPSGFDNNQDLPMFEYDRTKDFAFWPTPTIDDSQLTGGGYDFAYWWQHKAEAGSIEQLMAMCNIPKDVLKAMSTPNLAITCSNYRIMQLSRLTTMSTRAFWEPSHTLTDMPNS